MRELLLGRHGESVYNIEHRIQGQIHHISPLTQNGVDDAIALGYKLRDLGYSRRLPGKAKYASLHCSDLERANSSADIIGLMLMIKPCPNPLLREWRLGELEGKTIEEAGLEGYTVEAAFSALQSKSIRGAEAIPDVYARARIFLDSFFQSTGDWIVVAHGGINSCITNLILEEGQVPRMQANGSYHHFTFDDHNRLQRYELGVSVK